MKLLKTKPHTIIEHENTRIEITDHSINVIAKRPFIPIDEQLKHHRYMKKYRLSPPTDRRHNE